MPRKFTNLVFQGGGSAGVAYGGALAALEKLSAEGQFDLAAIRRVAGSSIGAIAALIVSLRYSAKEIVTIMRNLDFDALTGGRCSCCFTQENHLKKYGFAKTDRLHAVIKDLIRNKLGKDDITFGDLKARGLRDLYVFATKVYERDGQDSCEIVMFSAENAANTAVSAIVLASAAIPGKFQCVRLEDVGNQCFKMQETPKAHAFVDGGLFNNYPIDVFDESFYLSTNQNFDREQSQELKNPETLGFRLSTKSEIEDHELGTAKVMPIGNNRPIEFMCAIVNGSLSALQDLQFRKGKDANRTIFIDRLGVKSTNIGIDNTTKEQLIKSGFDGALRGYQRVSATLRINASPVVGVSGYPQNMWSQLSTPLLQSPAVVREESGERKMNTPHS